MKILPTTDDGSIRNAAILLTQLQLDQAVRDRAENLVDLAQGTLVETSWGVLTLGAIVQRLRTMQACQLDRLQAEVRSMGLASVSFALRLLTHGAAG